jgi:hypothetical protein
MSRLQHELDAFADHVDVATGADRVQQLGHVRLSQGHQDFLQGSNLAVQAEDRPVAPPQWWTRLLHHSLGRQPQERRVE